MLLRISTWYHNNHLFNSIARDSQGQAAWQKCSGKKYILVQGRVAHLSGRDCLSIKSNKKIVGQVGCITREG